MKNGNQLITESETPQLESTAKAIVLIYCVFLIFLLIFFKNIVYTIVKFNLNMER